MRNNLLKCLTLAVAGLFSSSASGYEDTSTRIFDPAFKTLKVEVKGHFMSPPIISLAGGEHLCVSFDELGDDRSYLRCSLVHCNSDWQPSSLIESEFLPSFNEADVDDSAFSSGVFRHYVNYRFCIPSESMRPLVSGNYLLRVYREGESDSPVLQARFSVTENAVTVIGEASSLTDRGNNDIWQQLSFNVENGHYPINDPYGELIVRVEQNGIDVTDSRPIKPQRVEQKRLIYEHNPSLIFPAGNEFRRFETVRTDYTGMHVAENKYEGDGYTVTLFPDSERASKPYTYDRTQFGRFKVDEYSATDPDLGADYVQTVFTLDFPHVTNGDILLDGEFVRALPYDERVMRYDPATRLYTNTLLLKQGSYNYRYVAQLDKKGAKPVPELVEGNHYETNNEYVVKVYQRTPGARYDRLIGHATITTK